MNKESEVPQVHVDKYETDEYTETFYQNSPDPWDNKGKYVKWFEGLVNEKLERKPSVFLYDIGCGGGHVLEGLVSEFSKISEDIKLTGVDISPTAIDYLNKDERFTDLLSEPFQCKSITDEDYNLSLSVISTAKSRDMSVFSIVDTFYYIRSESKWRAAADKLAQQVPEDSYILVADSAGSKAYRDYYLNSPELVKVGEGESTTPVVPASKGHRAKYLKWSIYRKLNF